MDLSLTDIVKDYVGHQWLALAIAVSLYVRRLLAADSKFPITLAQAWRSVVTGVLLALSAGFVLRQNGVSWGSSILAMFVTGGAGGLGDNLLSAVFGNSSTAPTWAKAIAFVWKDLSPSTGGTTGKPGDTTGIKVWSASKKKVWSASKKAFVSAPPPPPVQTRSAFVFGVLAIAGAVFGVVVTVPQLEGCTPAQQAEIKDAVPVVLADLQKGMPAQAIVNDVSVIFFGDAGPEYVAKAEDIVDAAILILKDTGVIPQQFPTLLGPADAVAGELAPRVAARRAARARYGEVSPVPSARPTPALPAISPVFGGPIRDAGVAQ